MIIADLVVFFGSHFVFIHNALFFIRNVPAAEVVSVFAETVMLFRLGSAP
jgi:hypothetical protein